MSADRASFDAMKADAQAAFASLEWVKPVVDPETCDPDSIEPFTRVGEQLYEQFEDAGLNRRMNPEVIHHAFVLASQGVGLCKVGYREHCQEAAATPSNQDYEAALVDRRTVRFFTFLASMNNIKNLPYEIHFDFRLESSGVEGTRFLYNPLDGHFAPNPFILASARVEAIREAEARGLSTSLTDKEPLICPARAVIPALWGITVSANKQVGLLEVEPQTSSLPLDLSKI